MIIRCNIKHVPIYILHYNIHLCMSTYIIISIILGTYILFFIEIF